MSLLDDLKRRPSPDLYLDEGSDGYAWRCEGCRGSQPDGGNYDCPEVFPHTEHCLTILMPRIVAAMEATGPLLRVIAHEQYGHREDVRPTVDGRGTYSWCSGCDNPWPCRWSEVVAKAESLEAALRGKESAV